MDKVTYQDEILGHITIHGIGKFVIESSTEWNIPNLHYITYLSDENQKYTSFCLELDIHYSDSDFKKTIQEMIRASLEFLNSHIIKKEDMDKLIIMAKDTENEYLWSLYRQCEFTLAKEKSDLSSAFIQEIRIATLQEFVQQKFFPDSVNYSEVA
ncbi:MAG: hypothetical protein ACRC0X_02685 [Brevinema sp.]